MPSSALLCLHCRPWRTPVQPPHQEAGALAGLLTSCPGFLFLPPTLVSHCPSQLPDLYLFLPSEGGCAGRWTGLVSIQDEATPCASLCPERVVLRPAPAVCLSVWCAVGSQGSRNCTPVPLLLPTLQHPVLCPEHTDTQE